MSDKKPDIKKIKKISEDLLKKLSPEAQVNVLPQELTISIDVKTGDPQELIGENAEILLSLQHLLRAILRRIVEAPHFIELDVNSYKKRRKEYLKEMALSLANEVSLAKKEKHLPAMNAYERRIIHMELSVRPDVATESRGYGANRKVVIKPALK